MNIVISFLLASFVLLSPSVTFAQYGQYQVPTQILSILVDKTVGRPMDASKGGTGIEYVDNLTTSDYKFRPGERITFQIKVKNTANVKLTNVTVVDTLPGYLEFIEGGTYDAAQKTITIPAGDFEVGEEKVYIVAVRSVAQENLPLDQGLLCQTNQVRAYNDKVSDDDAAQFCIEKQVVKAETVPQSGPEHAVLLYSLTGLIGYAGLKLRARSYR